MLTALPACGVGLVITLGAAVAMSHEIEVGDALDARDFSLEAQRLELALQGTPVDATGHTVVERRRFDVAWAALGVGTGLAMPGALVGVYVELTAWERMTIGADVGLTLWGPAGGGYFRLRPIIWGGEGSKLLNAFVLQTSYTVARDGELDLMPCIDVCVDQNQYLDRTALIGALSAGFEHLFASGWSIHYDFGIGQVLTATPWLCRRFDDRRATPCSGSPPSDNLPVVSFAVGHTL